MDEKFREQDQAIADVSRKIDDSFENLCKLIKEQRSSPMQVKQTQQSVNSVEEDEEQEEKDGAEEQEEEQEEEEEESKSQE